MLLGPTISPDGFLSCKSPLLPFHNLQRQSFPTSKLLFLHKEDSSSFLTSVFLAEIYNYFLSYSLWRWRMAHSVLVCSSILYPWRDVPLQSFPILYISLCKASISIPNRSLSFSVESPFSSVSVLNCSVQTTTLQLSLAQELTKVTSCIWRCTAVRSSLTALSGSCFPRGFKTILSSHGKTSQFATLDKLEPCSGHDPLEAHCSWFPSHRAQPSDFIHHLQSISSIFQYNFWIPSSNTSNFSPRCVPNLKSYHTTQYSS